MGNTRLAVIGLNMGKVHVKNILSQKSGVELAALCDISEIHRPYAEENRIKFYTDYKETLCREKPDGVVIALPPHLHREVGEYCAERGVHILMEKPVSYTLQEADALVEAVNRRGVKMLVGHQHRFDPGVRSVKDRIQPGAENKLIGFHVFGVYAKPQGYFKDQWRRMRMSGGGPVTSNGIHDIDRIRYLCGEIETVTALMSNACRGFEVEDTAAVSIKCRNGAVGTYFISDCGYPASEFTDFYYTSGASFRFTCSSFYQTVAGHAVDEISLGDTGEQYHLRERKTNSVVHPVQDNHLAEMQHFIRVVKGLEEPVCTGEDGRRSLQALLAVIESAAKGKTISLTI